MNKREQELIIGLIDHVEAILESMPNPKGQVKQIRLKKVREGGSELHRLAGQAIFGYDMIKLVKPDRKLPAARVQAYRQDAFKQWSGMTSKQKSMLPTIINDECKIIARSEVRKLRVAEQLRQRELADKAALFEASEAKLEDDRHLHERDIIEKAVAKSEQDSRIVELEEMSGDATKAG